MAKIHGLPPFSKGERDKPVFFDYRAKHGRVTDILGLPPAPSRRDEKAREAVLLDALAEGHGAGRLISYSRNKHHYTGKRRYLGDDYTGRTVPQAVDSLAELDLLDTHIAPRGSRGRQSVFRATPKLLDAVPSVPALEHIARELLRLKDKDGHLVRYDDTERTHRMRRKLEDDNEAIVSVTLTLEVDGATRNGPLLTFPTVEGKDGPAVVNTAKLTLYRVFNGGWEMGGRRYGHWAQGVPKVHRKALRMDGVATVEPDYSQLHPRLLYAKAEATLDGDAYTVEGVERDVAKRAFNIIINALNYRSALGAVAAAIRGQLYDYFDGDIYRDKAVCHEAASLIAALKERHRPIERFFHTGVGLRLQYMDSVMAGNVMRFLRKKGIVSVPVHDSFIVQFTDEGQCLEAMSAALFEATDGRADMASDCREFRRRLNDLTQNCLTYGRAAPWLMVVPVRPRQLDLFGSTLSIPSFALENWPRCVAPVSVRHALESKRRAYGLTQNELASRVGISRPQLTNGLRGRFGFGADATARLKDFLLEDVQ